MVNSMILGLSRTVLSLYATLVLSLWTSWCQGLDISYCSPFNNAGGYPGVYSFYQSNGLCHDQCQGSFAFAVLQGYQCWCSNYVPEPQQSTFNCDQTCPGEGNEWCASAEAGVYAYFALSPGTPLGTSGTGSSTPSATSSPSSTPTPTSAPTSSYSSTPTPPPSTSIAPSSSTADPSSSPTPTPTPAPTEIYTSVTTAPGETRTIVITPTPAASSDATLGQSSTGGGVSTGKVVGIVLGVAVGIGALIGIGVYLWFRRRHMRRTQEEGGPETAFVPRTGDTSPSNTAPSRYPSQMSTAGLLGGKISRVNTTTTGPGPRNDQRPVDITPSSPTDRLSVATDQRLNPYALYMSEPGRASNVSLQDNHDYSRQLRVANPDH